MLPDIDLEQEINPDDLLRIIFDYTAKIADEKRLDHLLMLMADMGRAMVRADRCTVWLLDPEKGELRTRAAHQLPEIRIPSNSGLVGHTIATGLPVIIDDPYNDARFNPEVDRQTGYRTESILVTPIRNNDGMVMGAFQAINKRTPNGKFLPKDLEYLSLVAYYSGKSLESAMLANEIEETQKEIIFVMGEIGETRSKETGNHVKRVAEYSKILALKYGLSEEEAELIKTASPMHDIGKVAIPDAILNKPDKLTPEEYEIMKSHTVIGYNLLKGSKRRLLNAAAIIAIQHHEKWNGTGYPYGLRGEEIHLYGRITAVADVFDALGSERAYKKAWEIDRILQLFREERGEHFDPRLVDLFIENLDEFLKVRDLYNDVH